MLFRGRMTQWRRATLGTSRRHCVKGKNYTPRKYYRKAVAWALGPKVRLKYYGKVAARVFGPKVHWEVLGR